MELRNTSAVYSDLKPKLKTNLPKAGNPLNPHSSSSSKLDPPESNPVNPTNPRTPGSVRELYNRYVSEFKPENAALTPTELRHYYGWCDARYFPHLKHLPQSASILELGCGHGRILNYLRHKGFDKAKGIDISQQQIDIALRDRLDAELADVFEFLDRHSEGFEAVIAIDFAEHFTKDELLRMFEAIHAAMKPGGTLLLQTPNAEGVFARQVMYGDLTHETILSPG